MTRPLAVGSGLPGTEVWPEDAKEIGRKLGLVEDAVVVGTHSTVDDGAGVRKEMFAWGVPQPGRIDPVGRAATGTVVGGQVNEDSSHVITVYGDITVSVHDRARAEGREWLITAVYERTERMVTQFEVVQA